MMVRGMSNLDGGRFERYVYEGEYAQTDYLDHDEIREFATVKSILAGRDLRRVRHSELWRVLAGNIPSGDEEAIPRLNLLPIRRQEEYAAFRNVFARLLSLANADARTLRQLIIDSHAREIGERKIDVAADYRDEFERAERTDHELSFVRSVSTDIDRAKELRFEIQAVAMKLLQATPPVWNDAMRCHAFLAAEKQHLEGQLADLEGRRQSAQSAKGDYREERGGLLAELKAIEEEWSGLTSAHQKWSAYPSGFIQQMRKNVKQQAEEIAELERFLDQAEKTDLGALRRHVAQIRQQVVNDQRVVDHWDRIVVAELRRAGISDDELDTAFRIANPDLLTQVVGETVTIKDLDATVRRIQEIGKRVADDLYTDETVTIVVADVCGPDFQDMHDPEEVRHRIELKREDLSRQDSRLEAAEDQQKARDKLDNLKKQYEPARAELQEYDNYLTAWSRRTELETRRDRTKEQISKVTNEINTLEDQLRAHSDVKKRLESDRTFRDGLKENLASAAQDVQQELKRLDLDSELVLVADVPELDEAAKPESLEAFANSIIRKLLALATDARQIVEIRSQLKQLQEKIAAKSQDFEGQRCYFSDEEEEWQSLIDKNESLPQMEDVAAKNWNDLFTTLGARFNGIVTAVRNIRTAVERLNRGLKSYRVSNLLAVSIKVREENDTYPAVEALSGANSLFHDRDAVDIAKKHLRGMIDKNEPLNLETLFELQIEIQETDGSWHRAASIDEIGSTGTGMTAKAMIFIQLVRAIADNERFRLHFFIDGLGELDDYNLGATAAMAVSKGIIPITADPRLHLEPLAHPEVTIYALGQSGDGKFCIDKYKTYHARRRNERVGSTSE